MYLKKLKPLLTKNLKVKCLKKAKLILEVNSILTFSRYIQI